jgi:tRNA(Glu) U13 pseudouridine synthase TruD
MKLEQHPDDFQVEEVTSVRPGAAGAFALYRLRKRGWSTPDALAVVRRRWGLAPRQLRDAAGEGGRMGRTGVRGKENPGGGSPGFARG